MFETQWENSIYNKNEKPNENPKFEELVKEKRKKKKTILLNYFDANTFIW